MPKSLIWLPDVLEKAGLKVSLVPGWEDRGYADRNMQDIQEKFEAFKKWARMQLSGNKPV